jgi:hypothetical protein
MDLENKEIITEKGAKENTVDQRRGYAIEMEFEFDGYEPPHQRHELAMVEICAVRLLFRV